MVTYAATTLAPASAPASATTWTSAACDEAHWTFAREKTSASDTRIATAEATVVDPRSSQKSPMPASQGRLAALCTVPYRRPITVSPFHPSGSSTTSDTDFELDVSRLVRGPQQGSHDPYERQGPSMPHNLHAHLVAFGVALKLHLPISRKKDVRPWHGRQTPADILLAGGVIGVARRRSKKTTPLSGSRLHDASRVQKTHRLHEKCQAHHEHGQKKSRLHAGLTRVLRTEKSR